MSTESREERKCAADFAGGREEMKTDREQFFLFSMKSYSLMLKSNNKKSSS